MWKLFLLLFSKTAKVSLHYDNKSRKFSPLKVLLFTGRIQRSEYMHTKLAIVQRTTKHMYEFNKDYD